jgi:dihydrofolate synthase/folylpolyglutamate synthase
VQLIFGAMRDKAIDEISGVLFPCARKVIVTAPRQARALAPDAIAEMAHHGDLRTAATLQDALAMVADATPEEAIFITGSLFLVAEALKLLPKPRQGR